MLARLCRADGPRYVQMIRQGIVDRVDIRVVDQFLVGAVSFGNVEVVRRRFGALAIARSNRRNFGPVAGLHRRELRGLRRSAPRLEFPIELSS